MKKKIAITGGIGSGKSEIGKLLRALNYPVFSCDEIYKNLINDVEYLEALKKVFPLAVNDGKLDKTYLSNVVFSDKTARERLNLLAHPCIMETIFKEMDEVKRDLVFAEVPLLFEGGYQKDFDYILVVMREKEKRIQAICNRDDMQREQALNRICSQYDYDLDKNDYLKKSNVFILKNNTDIHSLKIQLKNILTNI